MEASSQEWNNIAFGRYRIESTLGEGGMGIVYQAFDTHLYRTVALKVLRPSHLTDSRHIQRFLLEARAASALNHPNICTVYDAGQVEDDCYIVLEYLQGETLRAILQKKNKLPLDQVLQMGIALCHALDEAHRKGIIHRDIKPENIMITEAGKVKIMDFGLAKLKQATGDYDMTSANAHMPVDNSPFASSMSSFLGTAAYMSPEQIQKTTTDERTDLFSLGMVLHECLGGRHPFQGNDTIAIMKSIVCDSPRSLQGQHSVLLSSVLEKAMAKKPEQRFRDADSVRRALQRVQNQVKFKRALGRWSAAAVLAILLLLFLAFGIIKKAITRDTPPAGFARLVSIGQTMETEEWPAFSPDGRNIIYSLKRSEISEGRQLCIKNIESQHRKLVPSSEFSLEAADWSPDGQSLAYTSLAQGIMITDTSGVQTRQIAPFGYMPRWSPDGTQLAFSTNDPLLVGVRNEIYCYTLSTGLIEKITPDDGAQYAFPEWSPDGRWLLATVGEGSIWELCLLDPVARTTFSLTHKGLWIKNPVWSRKKAFIYYISNQNGYNEVWRHRIHLEKKTLVGEPVQITSGADIDELDISAASDRLLLTRTDVKSEIWRVQLSGTTRRPVKQASKLLAINGNINNLALAPRQDKLALEILEKGTRFLLVRSLLDSTEKTLNCGRNMFSPTWSPDGRWVYFDAGGGNQADIYRMNIRGGGEEKVVDAEGADWMPTLSPTGERMCFFSNRSGSFQLWLSNVYGQEPICLTSSDGVKSRASWSHDGKKLAYFENETSSMKKGSWISIYDVTAGRSDKVIFLEARQTPMTTTLVWRWDDAALYYISPDENGVLYELDLADLSTNTFRLADFGFPFLPGSFALDHDIGYFILLNNHKDIWITEGSL